MPDRTIVELPFNHVWIEIPDPTLTVQGNWTASCMVTRQFIVALRDCFEFRPRYHPQLQTDGRKEIQWQKCWETKEAFSVAPGIISPTYIRRLRLRRKTGVWLFFAQYMVNK